MVNEAPSVQGGDSVKLQPTVSKNKGSQYDVDKDEMCNVSIAEPLYPSVSPWADGVVLSSTSDGSTKKIDRNRWAKRLLALLKVASICKSKVDIFFWYAR